MNLRRYFKDQIAYEAWLFGLDEQDYREWIEDWIEDYQRELKKSPEEKMRELEQLIKEIDYKKFCTRAN